MATIRWFLHHSLVPAMLLLGVSLGSEALAVCTVTLQDVSPALGATKNVGQEIQLNAATTGTVTSIAWAVEGDVIDDYVETEPGPFSLTDHIEVGVAPPIASFAGTTIRFYWRELGQPLGGRNVTVTASDGGGPCATDSTVFTIERNAVVATRQPEDFYLQNHVGIVNIEHSNWHTVNRDFVNNQPNRNFDGAEFLCFHRRFVERFDAWRATFGYAAIGTYDPGVVIPPAEGGFTLAHTPRTTAGGLVPRPPWFTILGTGTPKPGTDPSACLVAGVYTKLSDFPSLDQLGCGIVSPYHNAVHGSIGGSMGSVNTAPNDPIFWRWHKFVGNIAFVEWAGTLAPDKQSLMTCRTPPPNIGTCGLPGITVEYDYDVRSEYETYTGKPATVPPTYVRVNGSPAKQVTGTDYGPYTYTGYNLPGTGPVTVTMKDGKYTYNPGSGKVTKYTRGDTYIYHNTYDGPGGCPCVDSDGDGIYDGACWPKPGYDNCPYNYNPDQYDSDSYYTSHYMVGDACQTYTCGNGIVEPGEQCDDANQQSGDGCRADCRSDESCPNGELDLGEDCDDGNLSNFDSCKNDCTGNGCGDGYQDYSSYYDDSYYYSSQPCDDGNNNYGDGCSGDCCPEVVYQTIAPLIMGDFDCHLRVIEQHLQYARYDLKVVRQLQKNQTKVRQLFERSKGDYFAQCRSIAKLYGKAVKLPSVVDKYIAKGLIPSGPGAVLHARAAAYASYVTAYKSLGTNICF